MTNGGIARPRDMELDEYIDLKLDILMNQFYLKLTTAEVARFRTLKTVSAVDQYAYDLIQKKL